VGDIELMGLLLGSTLFATLIPFLFGINEKSVS
ncbi:uncharacterized protein METZ01_LOCUS298610, partial [marine metagenome]